MKKYLEYLNKLKELRGKLDTVIEELDEGVYDFSKVLLDSDSLDEMDLNIEMFMKEKFKQQDMERQVKVLVKDVVDKYYLKFKESDEYDGCLEHEYYYYHFFKKFKINSFKNYYHIWFDGKINESFVFDKNGNLVFRGSHVEDIDDNNFIGLRYDRENFDDKAYHYEFKGDKLELVKVLSDVNNVEFNKYFDDDLIVFVTSDEYMLYNYKNREIVIPSFSSVSIENESIKGVGKSLFVQKKIVMTDEANPVEVTNLGYFVEKNGLLEYPYVVLDLVDRDNFYLLNNRGNNQEEAINSIYDEVKDKFKKRNDIKKKSLKVK